MTVTEGCPAFNEGCPFADIELKTLASVMEAVPGTISVTCPAFKEGCPFKASDSVEALYNRLSEMPASHRVGHDSPAAKAVELTLKKVHEQSKALKAKLSTECPVFATSCPFKTVTSDGEPLVKELDEILSSWDLTDPGAGRAPEAGPDGEAQPSLQAKSLSGSLKAGTRSVHRAAENVRFVRDFLRGAVPRESYVELLRALYHVYSTLERAIDSLPRCLQHVEFQKLRRTEALEADLRYYAGLGAGEELCAGSPSPAARQYAEHLERLAREQPLLILAHAYTRYLGDLSGGQILARAAAKAYGLPEGEGAAFYNFEMVGGSPQEVKAFKRSYRESLDALRLPSEKADAMVSEANAAFVMNILLFEERDVAAGHIHQVRSVAEVLELVKSNSSPLAFQKAYAGGGGGGPSAGAKGKCPFLPAGDPRHEGGAAQEDGPTPRPHGTCPWPFIWLHDPRSAWLAHPAKNAGGLLALLGLCRAFWCYPRRTGGGLLATGMLLHFLRPTKKKRKSGDPTK